MVTAATARGTLGTVKVPCPRCHTNVALVDRSDGTPVAWQRLRVADHGRQAAPGTAPVPCPASGETYGDVVAANPDGE